MQPNTDIIVDLREGLKNRELPTVKPNLQSCLVVNSSKKSLSIEYEKAYWDKQANLLHLENQF